MMRRAVYAGGQLVALFLFVTIAAHGQAAVQQTGPATRGDGVCFVQNGIVQDCGFPPASATSGNCLYRSVASGTADQALTTDCTIAWNSAATGTKTEFLYVCSSSTKSAKLTIIDQIGTADSYLVAVQVNGGNHILLAGDTFTAIPISFNGQSYTMQCDGNGNWIAF